MDSWNPFYSHQSLSPDDQPSPPVAETKQQHSGTSSTKVSDRQVGQPFLFRQPQLDDAFFQTPGLYPTTPTDLALTCHSISSTLPSPDVYNLLGNVENPASHSRELPAAVSLQHSALDSSAEWHDDAGTQAFSADGGLGISSQLPGWTRSISTPSSSYQPLSGFPIVPAGPAPMFSPIASTTTPVYPFQWTNHIVPDNHACPDPTMTGLFPNTTFANMAPVASLDAPALPIAAPPAWSVALSSQHSPLELLATPALSPADTDSTLPQTPHPPQLRRLNEPRLPGHFHPYLPPSSRKLISQTEQPATSSGRKSCREMTVACLACSRPVFRLYKRGTAQQLDRASQNHYRCQSCSDQSVSAPLSKG